MVTILIGNWWAVGLRGAIAVLFGIVALVSPTLTATALVVLFGIYALVDGIFALVAAMRTAERQGRSRVLMAEAVFDFIVAAIAFFFPHAALTFLVFVIAFWALLTGIALIAVGVALLRARGDFLLLLSGVLSLVLGIALLFNPSAGVVALAWWLGLYALLFGIVLLSAASRLRWYPAA